MVVAFIYSRLLNRHKKVYFKSTYWGGGGGSNVMWRKRIEGGSIKHFAVWRKSTDINTKDCPRFTITFSDQQCLRGAWTDRDTNNIFAHCSLIFYFLDFKFSNFVCLSELHPLIWFFFKNSFRKKKNIQKTTQNALAPSIFILLSIVLKLGTPLLHTQAQNTLLQNFQFRSRSRDMDEKPPKTLFYPTRSALTQHNFFRRSKLKNL